MRMLKYCFTISGFMGLTANKETQVIVFYCKNSKINTAQSKFNSVIHKILEERSLCCLEDY